MTNEEAKMQIQSIPEKIWNQLSKPDREAMEMAFSALEKQIQQEWIPCKPSELPKDKKLWVTYDRWGCRYVDEVFWDMIEWSDNVSDVVAYMPYAEPEPYKEEDDDKRYSKDTIG